MPATRWTRPEARPDRISRRRARVCRPVRHATESPSGAVSAWMVSACCSARISVGAISAACEAPSTADSIAAAATRVLPDPTSPCSSRRMGLPRARSPPISSIARCWAPVGSKGNVAINRAVRTPFSVNTGPRPSAPVRQQPPQAQLEIKQLIEREPAPGRLHVLSRVRKMKHGHGLTERGRPDTGPQRVRQGVFHIHVLQRVVDDAAQPATGESLGLHPRRCRIDGYHASCMDPRPLVALGNHLDVGVDHLPLAAESGHFATDSQEVAGRKRLTEVPVPRKPDAFQGARLVLQHENEPGPPARNHVHVANLGHGRDLPARTQIRDAGLPRPVHVPVRHVEEEVRKGRDSNLTQQILPFRADAARRTDGKIQFGKHRKTFRDFAG